MQDANDLNAIPLARTDGGLPVGAQIIGPMFEDRTTLRFAELLERELGGCAAPRAHL
jgi:amidase